MPSSNRSCGAHGARHRASSLHGALPCFRPLPRHCRRPVRAGGTACMAIPRLISRRPNAGRPVSAHESWGGAMSTSTASTASGGRASVQFASCWPAALAAPDRGSPRWLSGDRLPRPCLGTAPRRRSNGEGRNHLVRALPARARYRRPAFPMRCTTTTRGAAYGGALGRIFFREHSYPPRSSSRLRSRLGAVLGGCVRAAHS
jgi:hypothetical protein